MHAYEVYKSWRKMKRERMEKQFILVDLIKIIAWPDTVRIVLKVGYVALMVTT